MSSKAAQGIALLILCAAWPQRVLSHETLTTTVLFDREIVRILNKHCVMCHFEKGPAFPLETWEQTWLHARRIRSEAISRHMPPWSAFPGYGQFANDNGLTLRETQFLVSWVEGYGPRNAGTVFTNTADQNVAPRKEVTAHLDTGHWALGEPELKLPVSGAAIATGLKSERRIRAIEYMPTNRAKLHAVFFTVQETGQWIGAWTPWYGYFSLPKGWAWKLPAGAHIAVSTAEGSGTLGIYFADPPATKSVADLVLDAKGSQRVRAVTKLSADTDLLALRIESQSDVQSIEVSARRPDGTTEVLLFDKNIRREWPTPYIFKSPVPLPRGTELAATAHYPGAGAIQVTAAAASAHL